MCGLIYEVVWMRMLTVIFGNTVFATSTVLAVFMAGLALGSFYFGRLIDKRANVLRLYGILEIGIGGYALLLPVLLSAVTPFYIWIYRSFGTGYYLLGLIRFVVSFCLLLWPTICMGATLPVLTRYFAASQKRLGKDVGLLYGLNTFGAVLGCFASGFLLIQILGVKQTAYLAALLNIIIGIIVLALQKKPYPEVTRKIDPEGKTKSKGVSVPKKSLTIILMCFGLSGFAALAYEVLWMRSLVYIMATDTFSFSAMLTTFLLGLAAGSLIGSRFVDSKKRLVTIFGWLEVGIGTLAVAGIPLMAWLMKVNEGIWRSGGPGAGWTLRAEIYFIDTVLVMFLPALLMGMTFPLVSKIFTPDIERRGRSIGKIYAVNTIGAILGSFAGGFLLIPFLGIQSSIALIATLNGAIGVLLVLLDTGSKLRASRIVPIFFALLIAIVTFALPRDIIPTLFAEKKKGFDLVYFKEGVTTTTTVHKDTETGELLLATNGISVAGTDFMLMTTQRIQGHFPLFLHPHLEQVLTVGFGSGETSWVISTHGVDRVDCVEISPEVVEAARFFTAINHSFVSKSRFTPIIMDGKNYVLMTDRQYDVIMNDSIHPALAGNGSLYAKEYFSTCRDHLHPGGLMSSWIPLFGLSERDFKILLKTFQDVFPFTTLWYGTNCLNRHALLIGSTDPEFKIDINVIQERISSYPSIHENLREIGIEGMYGVLSSFVLGPETIARYVGDVPVNTDNRPILEFSTPKTPDSPAIWRQKLHQFTQMRDRVDPFLIAGDDLPDEGVFSNLSDHYKATGYMIQGWIKDLEGERKKALQSFQEALQYNPQAWGASRYIRQYYEPLLDPDPESIGELLDNAKIYYQIGDLRRSIESFRSALDMKPDLAMAYYGLGRNYEALSDKATAIEMYRKSLEIDPNGESALARLKALTSDMK